MSTQNTSVTANTELFKEDGSINNTYANPNDSSQFATSPNTTTDASKSNTGSGLQAPEVNQYDSSGNLILNDAGKPVTEKLQYSWESKADERANLDYQSNILETKASMLENRQQLESQGQQLQDQAAMAQYNRNQSAEKVGWTGGYILDSERQMNYLKQSIQSQMYGQMELQKYGYDTSLAAARLAYDTNRYDLALEYYNTALSRAVTEAEITGYYVSPEASEMLDQYHIASKALNENPEDAQAQSVLKAVYDWFEGHGISKNGVETFEHLTQERAYRKSLFEDGNEKLFQYADGTFAKVDANGNYSDEIINFNTMANDEIVEYINSSPMAQQQFYSILDTKLQGTVQESFNDWLEVNHYMNESTSTGSDGKTTTTYSKKAGVDYLSLLYKYLVSSNSYASIKTQLDDMVKGDASALENTIKNWDFTVQILGESITLDFKTLEEKVANAKNELARTKNVPSLNSYTEKSYDDSYAVNLPEKKTYRSRGEDIDAYKLTDDVIITNSDVNDYGSGENHEWDDKVQLSEDVTSQLCEIYKRAYNTDKVNDFLIVYEGSTYVYLSPDKAYGAPNRKGKFTKVNTTGCGTSSDDFAKWIEGQVG